MDYHSHSDNPSRIIKEFFSVGPAGIILLNVLALAVLLVANSRDIWSLIRGDEIVVTSTLGDIFSERFSLVNRLFDTTLFDRLGLLLFWAMVGCVTYMLMWLIQYALTSARKDFVEGHYIHPRTYSSRTYWRTMVAHRIFLLSNMFVFAVYLFFMIRVGLPILAKLFYIGFHSIFSVAGITSVVVAVLILAVCMYAGYLLWKILRGTWGLVGTPD